METPPWLEERTRCDPRYWMGRSSQVRNAHLHHQHLHTGLTKVVIYGDNTGIIEGWWAGRHRNPETNNIFQCLHSFLAQTNHGRTVRTCYVPSAENPVDSPSRGKYPPAHLLPRIPIPPPLVPFIIDVNDPLTPVEQEFTPSPPNFSSNSLHSRRRNIQDSHSRW
jgi:hypothetical protein